MLSPLPLLGKELVETKKGTFWDYQAKIVSAKPLGVKTGMKPIKEGENFVYFFEEKRVSNGIQQVSGLSEKAMCVEIFLDGSKEAREEQYYTLKDGVYSSQGAKIKGEKGDSTVFLASPMPIFSVHAQSGAKWKWGDEKGMFEFRVIGEEEVICPAGVFQAFKIQMDHTLEGIPKRKRFYWFAKGVGLVKEKEDIYLSKGVVVQKIWELKDYSGLKK